VELDDDLARKLREAIHKEALAYSEQGSPAAVTQFLKDLLATYGQKPDKNTGGPRHYLLHKQGFIKAVEEVLKHLSPDDANAIWLKMETECGPTINYKVRNTKWCRLIKAA
jgi:hypothetical protein